MEIELFIRETFRKMYFSTEAIESQECNHYWTSMVEKVENDGREEVACPVCQKPILLPPSFQCDRCDVPIHISCLQVEGMWNPDKRVYLFVDEYVRSLILHCGPGHGLIIEEEEEEGEEKVRYDDEKKQVVCFACNEPLLVGRAYKCSASHCPLLFHKSCAHFPRLTQHPLSSDAFVMRLPLMESNQIKDLRSFRRCDMCGKRCINCIYYSNTITDEFVLDVICANGWQVNDIYNCQPHKFIPIKGNFLFTCQLCGTKGQDLASQCTTCRLFVHGRCSGFSRAIRISRHEHSLALTFPLRQLKDSQNLSRNICAGKVNAEYAAYCCKVCDFVAHLHCTDQFWLRDETEESLALVTHDVEEMPLTEIHPHDLILSHEQLKDDKICDACMQFIWAPPFYHCAQCHFFLHSACARLPRERRHPVHPHTLTLLSRAPMDSGLFYCDVCGRICNGFTYKCTQCAFYLHVHCCSFPQTLTHPSHQHSLFLAMKSEKRCNACGGRRSSFLCNDCDYSLCYRCITLPLRVRHEHDEHPLILTYVVEDEYKEYYCLICEKERDPKCWFYYMNMFIYHGSSKGWPSLPRLAELATDLSLMAWHLNALNANSMSI